MKRLALLPSLLLLGCAGGDYAIDGPTTDAMKGGDWRDEIIYQLLVDRAGWSAARYEGWLAEAIDRLLRRSAKEAQ